MATEVAAAPFSSRGYIGNKFKLLEFIVASLQKYGVARPTSVADLFCGTDVVAHMFASMEGMRHVLANDVEPYAAILTSARLSKESQATAHAEIALYEAKAKAAKTSKDGVLTRYYSRPDRPLFTREHAGLLDRFVRGVHLDKEHRSGLGHGRGHARQQRIRSLSPDIRSCQAAMPFQGDHGQDEGHAKGRAERAGIFFFSCGV